MGDASINIDALERLIDNISVVDAALTDLDSKVSTAMGKTHEYPYYVNHPSSTTFPDGTVVDTSWVELLSYVPASVISALPMDAFQTWKDTWPPFLHRALGYAYELRKKSDVLGPGIIIPCGKDLDTQIAAATPALTPREIPVVGAQIGVKVASGKPLTGDEWAYWSQYGGDTQFVTALMGKCTVAQIGDYTGVLGQQQKAVVDTFKGRDLSADEAANYSALAADYQQQVSAMATTLATWAGMPGNSDAVSQQIVACLQDNGAGGGSNPFGAAGMAVLVNAAHLDRATADSVAESMYGWAVESSSVPYDVALPDCVFPDGSLVVDVMVGVMGMLQNCPEAATDFFGNMSGATAVSVDGTSVDVSARVQWAVDRNWADGGAAAGLALAEASLPLPGQLMTAGQARVGTQSLDYIASLSDPLALVASPGISCGAAMIISGNMPTLFAVTPYIDPASGSGDAGLQAGADESVSPLGVGRVMSNGQMLLGVNDVVLGLVIQKICGDPYAKTAGGSTPFEIMAAGLGSYLPDYFGGAIGVGYDEVAAAYAGTLSASAFQAPAVASGALAFLVNNALHGQGYGQSDFPETDSSSGTREALGQMALDIVVAAVTKTPTPVAFGLAVVEGATSVIDAHTQAVLARVKYDAAQAQQAGQQETGTEGMGDLGGIFPAYIQVLAGKGYFDPATVSAISHDNPVLKILPMPPQLAAGGTVDPNDPEILSWIMGTDIGHAKSVIGASGSGNMFVSGYVMGQS